ncbi:MAG: hypothetical protein HY721_29330 [Planctomycetes bacterium]|nr:hypothetical protein [Planctomycetota bacterium]
MKKPRRRPELHRDVVGGNETDVFRFAAEMSDLGIVEAFEETLDRTGPAILTDVVEELAGKEGRAVAFALAFLAEHPHAPTGRAAVEALGRSGEPMARWFLEGMARYAWRNLPSIHKALASLRRRRVACPEVPVPREWRIEASHADGRGSLAVRVTMPEGPDTIRMVSLLLNDQVGVKDCFGGEGITRSEYREIEEFGGQEVDLIPIDVECLERLLRHALWVARGGRKTLSMDFSARRALLGDLDATPVRFVPDLSAYRPEACDVRGTETLLLRKPYDQWWLQSPKGYDFVREIPLARRAAPQKRDVDAFVRAFYVPVRGRLLDRLGWTLTLSSKYARNPEPQAAVRLYHALSSDAIPMEEIPFIRDAAELSILYAAENLAAGFAAVPDYSEEPLW